MQEGPSRGMIFVGKKEKIATAQILSNSKVVTQLHTNIAGRRNGFYDADTLTNAFAASVIQSLTSLFLLQIIVYITEEKVKTLLRI